MNRQDNEHDLPQFPGSTEPEAYGSNDPTDTHESNESNESDVGVLRDELIALAEAGDIKQSVKTIKKANADTLVRIKRDYVRKQTEEVNELVSNELITKLSDLLNNVGMIDDPVGMSGELSENKLLKRDLKNIVGMITPYIPLVGLVCGGVIVGKHVLKNRSGEASTKITTEQS